MLRDSEGAPDVNATVASLAIEAALLEERVRLLRDQIGTIDTQMNALSERLRAFAGQATSPADAGEEV